MNLLDDFAADREQVLCLFRRGKLYKLGGLGTPAPTAEWQLVARFALDFRGEITADGDLAIDQATRWHYLSPEAVALVGPDGWFGLRPIEVAKPPVKRKKVKA